MTRPTLLPGVRLHPNGKSFQVRVHPFDPEAGFTAEEANEYSLLLRRLKRQGITTAPGRHVLHDTTLAEAAHEHLARLERVGGRRGRPYTPDGLYQARNAARPWTGDAPKPRRRRGEPVPTVAPVDERGVAFATMPLAALTVRPIEIYLERRHELAPRAAAGEYQSLLAILRLAARRGERFDQALLELEPVRRGTPAKRRRLTPAEMRYAADRAPEYIRRAIPLMGTTGGRPGETLLTEDGWLDLEQATLTVPEWACKERREKIVDLLPEEVRLYREQRLVRSPQTVRGRGGTLLVFPRANGTPWPRSDFYNSVARVIRRDASRDWRADHQLDAGAPTPFDNFTSYDLRRSAATILREARIPPELAARRFGHKDGGHLLVTVYADTRREALRAELAQIADEGGLEARLAGGRA